MSALIGTSEYNGQVGGKHFVHGSEVVPSLEIEIYGQNNYRQGANSFSIFKVSIIMGSSAVLPNSVLVH